MRVYQSETHTVYLSETGNEEYEYTWVNRAEPSWKKTVTVGQCEYNRIVAELEGTTLRFQRLA